MSGPRVLIVQNTAAGGPRRLESWLRAGGLELDVARPFDGMPLPGRLGHDAVVVLGGGFMPDDDGRAPWLPATRALVGQAVDDGRPVLGICLGGQLLAQVTGGTVRARHGAPEHGSTPIRLRPEAAGDPLFGDLPPVVPAIEHHVDAITGLPPDAVWLADSKRCPYQAFRVRDSAWGVQFHPEAEPARIARWDAGELARQGLDRDELLRQAAADDPAASAAWRALASAFAAVVRSSRPAT